VAPNWGKAGLGFCGGRGVWGLELHRGEGLLNFFQEGSEYGIKDSISRKGVIIIGVVVFSCLSMYVEALYCVDTHLETWWWPNARAETCRLINNKHSITFFSCVLTLLPAPFYCIQHNGDVTT